MAETDSFNGASAATESSPKGMVEADILQYSPHCSIMSEMHYVRNLN